jgi:hypothetical protein
MNNEKVFAFKAASELSGKDIIIPDGYTRVNEFTPEQRKSMESLFIPKSVTSINKGILSHCNPATITVAEENEVYSSVDGVLFNKDRTELIAFPVGKECDSYTIPEGVTRIGDKAFCYCIHLKSITIPDSVTNIGNSAFCGCEGLSDIIMPNSVTRIDSRAFRTCKGLTDVKMPDILTHISYDMFWCCEGLKSVKLPSTLKSIDRRAFYGCDGLTSVEVPDLVRWVGHGVFESCNGLSGVTYRGKEYKMTEKDLHLPKKLRNGTKDLPQEFYDAANEKGQDYQVLKPGERKCGASLDILMSTNETGCGDEASNSVDVHSVAKIRIEANSYYEALCAAFNEAVGAVRNAEVLLKHKESIQCTISISIHQRFTDSIFIEPLEIHKKLESANALEALGTAFHEVLQETQKYTYLPTFGRKENYSVEGWQEWC